MCARVSVSPRIRYTPGAKAFSIPPRPGTDRLLRRSLLQLLRVVSLVCVDAFEWLSARPRLEDDSG